MPSLQRSIVLPGMFGLLFFNSVLAQDWPQWRGPNRDNVLTGFTAPKEWPKELKQVWKKTVGLGDASPALVGDRLFVFTRQGDEETMLTVNAQTGEILWQEKQPSVTVTGGPRDHAGPRSTPTVADGKVYALGVGGVLSCWDASTGKVIWRKDSGEFDKKWPTFFTSMSPIIVDRMCIAHLGSEANGAIVAFDMATGEEKWRNSGEGPSYGSPVLMNVGGTRMIVMETAKSIVGVNVADGKILWLHPLKGQPTGTPVIDGDTVIYTAQGTNAIKISKDGNEFKVDPLWTTASPAPRFSSPVLKNGFLYGAISTGGLFCLNAKTGEVAWTDSTRRGDPTGIVDAGNVLLALSSNSELLVFEPNEKEFKEVAKIKVADAPVWSNPIVSGNRLFVKDKDSLALWLIE